MRETLPSELTMLFSDIEGSTRLLNRLGADYADVLAMHRRILRTAFASARGRELGTEGDSFFVVFATALDAVTAAADGQAALEAGPWPDDLHLRVRMGLHTGRPEPFEDNLVGLDVHLCARISATAHGGQVVLSSATAGQVAHGLPTGTSLVDLGVHRLKDITEPQQLFQLVVPGVPHTFPPLRSLGAPGSLPSSPNPLIGRQDEVAAVSALLSQDGQRLVTLTGPGGTGKTRLSLAVAEELAPAYPEGVHFVDLATTTEHSMAWTTLAETFGRSGGSQTDLLDHLRDRTVLVVLDNLEQLPGTGAPVVSALLTATHRLRVLATSRRPLRVAGEQEYPVPPLGLPEQHVGTMPRDVAARAGSVQLFVQQARLADPRFALTDENVADVVALCRRLDGLPLAVELAAARVRLLPPRALLDHLDEALQLPLPSLPERQQTLVATVDWSYRMVGEPEQRAFRALAVFGAAGGTFEAVAAVLGAPSSLPALSGLLEAALVRVEDDPTGPRARLLLTVRSVALDLASGAGELDDLRRRHADHYLALAERAGDRMKGPDAMAARASIELEMDNLRTALEWSLGEPDGAHDERGATGIRLCTALGWFWYLTGYDAESRRWLERASRAAAGQQGPQLAQLLHRLGLVLLQQGDLVNARDVLAKSLLLWRRAVDPGGETRALNSLGVVYRAMDDTEKARDLLVQSVEVARSIEDPQRQATSLTNLALLEIDSGRPDVALTLLAEAERLDLGLGNAWGVAADRANRVGALLAAQRLDEAVALLSDLAGSVSDHGDPDLTLGVVELAAMAASMGGDHAEAVRLAACADEQRSLLVMPLADPDRVFLDRQLVVSRRALGDAVAEAERQGRALDLMAALAAASRLHQR